MRLNIKFAAKYYGAAILMELQGKKIKIFTEDVTNRKNLLQIVEQFLQDLIIRLKFEVYVKEVYFAGMEILYQVCIFQGQSFY